MSDQPPSAAPSKPCPICGKPALGTDRPFCSPRCADVDLNRWLGGAYVLPSRDDDDDQESDTAVDEPRD